MGIFDVFTGQPARDAAGANQALLRFVDERGRSDLTGAADQGAGYLNTGYGSATNALAGGYGTATGAVGTGADQALGYLGQARDPLSALAGRYGGATNLALGALGAGGQAGTDAARAAFQASPAYDFNLNQGIEAINRRRAASGELAGGNADRDAQNYGSGLASREYGDWMNRLLGFTNPELAATTGASGISRDMANVAGTRGSMLADLASRYGTQQAGLDTSQGQNLANLYTGAAQGRVGLDTALVKPYTQQTTDAAQASLTGSKNLWNLGIAGASAALGAPGLSTGLGPGASSANTGASGGGYYGAGGELQPGPGNYGATSNLAGGSNWLRFLGA